MFNLLPILTYFLVSPHFSVGKRIELEKPWIFLGEASAGLLAMARYSAHVQAGSLKKGSASICLEDPILTFVPSQ